MLSPYICRFEDTSLFAGGVVGPCLNRRTPSNIRLGMHEGISRNQTYVPRHVEYLEQQQGLGSAARLERDRSPNKGSKTGEERDGGVGTTTNSAKHMRDTRAGRLPKHPEPFVRACSRELVKTQTLLFLCSSANDPRPVICCFVGIVSSLSKLEPSSGQSCSSRFKISFRSSSDGELTQDFISVNRARLTRLNFRLVH